MNIDIISAISTVGFPCVSFLLCAWFIKYTFDKMCEQTKDTMEKLGNLTEAVNDNTQTLSKLVDEITRKDK